MLSVSCWRCCLVLEVAALDPCRRPQPLQLLTRLLQLDLPVDALQLAGQPPGRQVFLSPDESDDR
jgi:hypothetical protein